MTVRCIITSTIAAATLAGGLLAAGPAHAAGNQVVDCRPERVRSTADRMDTRCTGIDRWFIAWRNQTDPNHFDQMIELLNAAILNNKTVKLYYDLDGSSNGTLWAVELFR